MAYSEFKFDPKFLQEQIDSAKAALKDQTGREDFVAHACEVISFLRSLLVGIKENIARKRP